jgi:DNA-binding NarL/FixJ family response regulator
MYPDVEARDMKTKDQIKLLVVDDHPTFRMGLVALVESQPDMTVVAEAGDGQTAIDLFLQKKPDVVLMDLRMPGQGGVETILALLKLSPGAKIIVVTTYDLDEDIFRAIQAGAKSYLLKDMARAEVVETIRAVQRGEAKLPPGVLSRLEERSRRQELSEREMEILQLIVKGRSNKEISSALFIAEDTVKYHLKALFAKLGVQDRTEAAISAIRHGIVHLE